MFLIKRQIPPIVQSFLLPMDKFISALCTINTLLSNFICKNVHILFQFVQYV